MITKLDRENPFGHGSTYGTAARAERAAVAKLDKMPDYPHTFATVLVVAVEDRGEQRYAPRILFQGKEAVQAAVHGAHFTGFRCFA
jgi:hypothetical protein